MKFWKYILIGLDLELKACMLELLLQEKERGPELLFKVVVNNSQLFISFVCNMNAHLLTDKLC